MSREVVEVPLYALLAAAASLEMVADRLAEKLTAKEAELIGAAVKRLQACQDQITVK